jgi:hypothetical protein
MSSERVDETFLVQYLLGNLTEEQEVEVEDRAFADANYLGALEAVEADLIDSYVRGQLSQAERRAFERRFLTSPSRRSKVEFARALSKVASESQAAGRPAGRPSLLGFMRGWSPTVRFATGLAALMFIAGVTWLIVQNAAMRTRVAELETQRRDRVIPPPQQQSPTPAVAAPPVVASLVLLPGLTRGEQRTEQLALNPSAQIVHIQIQLEARDDYPRFRLELRTRSGEEILTRSNLPRQETRAGYGVSFDVPASALAAGQYELALKGVLNDQSVQDVGYYYFTVQRH